MADFIIELKTNLEDQLAELTKKIRSAENDLLSSKETYLKVVGALEIVDVIKNKNKNNDQSQEELTAIGLAD